MPEKADIPSTPLGIIFQNPGVILILLGSILILVASIDQISFNGFNFQISNIYGRLALGCVGVIVGSIGLYIFIQKSNSEKAHEKKIMNSSAVTTDERINAEMFLEDRSKYAPFKERFAKARTIYMMGPSLVNVFGNNAISYFLNEKLNKQGTKIQLLIIDPDLAELDFVGKYIAYTDGKLATDIKYIISVADMVKKQMQAGSIEMKLMPLNPNFSMMLIDPDEPHGQIFVEFVGYRSGLNDRPHIELKHERDGRWYEYFLNQYKAHWNISKQI